MSYVVFARKYRPKDFDEIVGQDHITATLKNAIKQDRVAHAYLFSGPRGVGKTTTARILAKALNCEKGPTSSPCNKCISCQEISSSISMDVIEIDGASNRGIDEIRQLRENVKFSPVHGRYKMYIIDEVHMLTQEAFNALLKTLEEPPRHVKFVFATTLAQKVIATVSSRCQRFDFRRVSISDMVSKLKEITKKESIKADEETLFLIAKQAEGSLRDAESILDQLNTFTSGAIKKEDIARILGAVGEELLEDFAQVVVERDTKNALKFIDRLISEGKDLTFLALKLVGHFRNLMVAKLCANPEELIDLPPGSVEKLIDQAKKLSQEEIFYISNIISNAHESMKRNTSVRTIFEMAVIKAAKRASLTSLGEILNKIQDIEKRIENKTVERETACPKRSGKDPINIPSKNETAVKEKTPPSPPIENRNEEAGEESIDDVEFSKIQELWPTLLRIVRTKKISIASYLLEGSPIAIEKGCLAIGFPENYSLHKETLEERTNKLIIEETLKEVFNRPVRIKFITQEARRKAPQGDYSSLSGEKKPIESKMPNEPLIESALEVFDGRIIRKPKR
ncbi:MAG: DNA polymerase III subunit gamma/tau [Candidatus Omnitrophica bacterium]|nr:DNA polymerase III subunit gamma/tau [Candidatus Omnitrophota bacterium]